MSARYWIAVALLCGYAVPLSAQQMMMEHHQPRLLSVSATGTVQRQPDRATLLVAVESRANSAQEAARANAGKMDAIYAALRRIGITPPDVQTVSYELQPQYNQPDPRGNDPYVQRIIGYTAVNMVRVQVDSVARAGTVIDATIAAGANRIANLSFELRDPEAARLEALRSAVQKARAEAEAIASAAGQRLGPPQNISSSSSYPPPAPMYRRADVEMSMAAPTPIEAGSLTISATVSINYILEDR